MKFLERGQKRKLKGLERIFGDILALGTSFYFFVILFFTPHSLQHRTTIFGLFFAMIFIFYTAKSDEPIDRVKLRDWILSLISLAVSLYFAINLDTLILRKTFVDIVNTHQIILGFVTILLVIEGSRRIGGIWLPIINIFSILYVFAGQFIPGRFAHLGFSVSMFIDAIFLGRLGLWGVTLGTAVSSIVYVIIFSTFLMQVGFDRFLFKVLNTVVNQSISAFGKMAVLASALFGMISGGGSSNASATGTITIPNMIRKGYHPEFAAAIESTASMASTFTPPVLGSVAFLMSELTGISYSTIVVATIFPSILFYFSLFQTIDYRAQSIVDNSSSEVEVIESKSKNMIIEGLTYFTPIIYFIFRLVSGGRIARVSIESVVLILVIFMILKRTYTVNEIPKTLIKAIKRTLAIIPMMVASGIFIGIVNLTGLVPKFSLYFSFLYSINFYLAFIFVAIIILFIGTALNTPTTYIISVVFFAPLFIQRGIEPLAVHLFFLFYSAMGSISPPVALTALTASTIANADFTRVTIKAMLLSLVAYIIPFIFIFNSTILKPDFSLSSIVFIIQLFVSIDVLVFSLYAKVIRTNKLILVRMILIVLATLGLFFSNYYMIFIVIIISLIKHKLQMKPRRNYEIP